MVPLPSNVALQRSWIPMCFPIRWFVSCVRSMWEEEGCSLHQCWSQKDHMFSPLNSPSILPSICSLRACQWQHQSLEGLTGAFRSPMFWLQSSCWKVWKSHPRFHSLSWTAPLDSSSDYLYIQIIIMFLMVTWWFGRRTCVWWFWCSPGCESFDL